jgi:hypothetical protein
MRLIFRLLVGFYVLSSITNAQIASGGAFILDQSVIATGGGTSAGGVFTVEGTAGQSVSGQRSMHAQFTAHTGFWNADPLGATAAGVPVSGSVQTADGRGIRNAHVTISSGGGIRRITLTGAFGYFHFEDVTVGETYILTVSSKQFQFAQPTQVITVLDGISDINFVAEPF